MRQPVTHEFVDDDGREHEEVLSAIVPTGPTQIVEYGELVMLNHRGGGDVAIIRDGHMGDILLLTPALRQLKQDLPNLRLHLYCDEPYVPLLDGNSHVESCQPIPKEINSVGGDIVADLQRFVERSPEAWITDRASLFARAFGMELRNGVPGLQMPVRDHTYQYFESNCKLSDSMSKYGVVGNEILSTVLIAPDASDPRRAMSDQLLERVLVALDERGVKYIVVGTERGERLGLRDALYYITALSGVLSVDNGMYHAAAALGVPATVLFTTVPPVLRTRWYGPDIVPVISNVDCSPCEEKPVDGCARACTNEFDAAAIAESVARTCVR